MADCYAARDALAALAQPAPQAAGEITEAMLSAGAQALAAEDGFAKWTDVPSGMKSI